jgi:NADH:ubiquinone oxidoreductase subunit 6 (subunit J)
MMSLWLLVIAAVFFAVQSIRAKRLIVSALWLAGVSALLSLLLYMYGAQQVAVMELSVGAGLVTVVFVFAISIAGEEAVGTRSVIPWPLAIGFALLIVFMLAWFVLPQSPAPLVVAGMEASLSSTLWQERGLDVLVQMVIIFAGVLGLLGLLGEDDSPLAGKMAREVSAQREKDLLGLEKQATGQQEAQG